MFKNSRQAAACWAQKRANPNSKWDCRKWAKETPKSLLRGKSKKKR